MLTKFTVTVNTEDKVDEIINYLENQEILTVTEEVYSNGDGTYSVTVEPLWWPPDQVARMPRLLADMAGKVL